MLCGSPEHSSILREGEQLDGGPGLSGLRVPIKVVLLTSVAAGLDAAARQCGLWRCDGAIFPFFTCGLIGFMRKLGSAVKLLAAGLHFDRHNATVRKHMKALSLQDTPIQTPAVQLARLSGSHGYRFDGDTVHLNAMFALLDAAAHEPSWALQLWACPSAPASASGLAGHIVAEVALPPMAELADETEHFEVSALAWPPAGAGEQVMVLGTRLRPLRPVQ